MKILMINVVCGIRSTGRICTDLATSLEAEGHEVKIAYGRENVPEKFQKYAVRIGNDFDVRLHGLKARLTDGAGFGSRKATTEFIRWVKGYSPDVIHLHNIHGYYINIELLFDYLRTCGKKIIWTLHDCWAFTGHTAYCDAVGCEKWKTGCGDCPNTKAYPKSYMDFSKRNWKKKRELFTGIPNLTIVTPSYWLAGLVRESFLSEYPVQVIHNGIDTSQFYPMENDFREFYGINDKFMLLGVATSWDDMKGLKDYIKLANQLDEKYQVVLVGLTKEQIGKLPGNVIGIERTNSVKELAYIYSAADLYLNLSYCENYPTVNLEAVACNTPVLTYRTGGSPESADKYGGIVVECGDIAAVVEAVRGYREVQDKKIDLNVSLSELDKQESVEYYHKIYGGGYWQFKQSLGLIKHKILIGVASTWEPRKGLEDFVKLSKMIDSKIIIVGITEKQKAALPKEIIAYTRTNDIEELRRFYAVADYYINPTYEDNYPTTNMEAVACGTPVITYNTGGSPESAFDGIVVPRGNVRALVDAVLSNKKRKNRISRLELDQIRPRERYLMLYYGQLL